MNSKARRALRDDAYAYAYAFEMQNFLLATQIKRLRQAQRMSQKELAERAGMKQARISLMESGDYSQWSVATLRKIARALNVGLSLELSKFYATLDRMESQNFDTLFVPTRAQERITHAPVATTIREVAFGDIYPIARGAVVATSSSAFTEAVGHA